MTAGSGIAHSERTEPEMRQSGFRIHGVQTWVALPQAHEEAPPTFEHVAATRLPAWQEGGTSLRLIVGTYAGRTAPTTHFSPIFYVAAEMPAAAKLAVTPDHAERGIYIAAGTATIGDRQLGVGDLAVLAVGAAVDLVAGTDGAKLMVLGGAALDGPRHIWWNFVSSSKERIERAKADWKEGRFAKVPGDPEFIPLPER
jgi:redox-sensitive bicupin YhaK (pirin superfamily)